MSSVVIIAGSRDLRLSVSELDELIVESKFDVGVLLNGGCPTGVDATARAWAKTRNVPVQVFPADWNKHGKAAGPIRNREMAERATHLIAVMKGSSPGTRNMVEEAKKRGLIISQNYM